MRQASSIPVYDVDTATTRMEKGSLDSLINIRESQIIDSIEKNTVLAMPFDAGNLLLVLYILVRS